MRAQMKILGFVLFSSLFSSLLNVADVLAAEVDISKLKKQCEKITASQRQMAKAAGYDIESICESLNDMGDSVKEIGREDDGEEDEKKSFYSRDSKLTLDERGVIEDAEDADYSVDDLLLTEEQLAELEEAEDFEKDKDEDEEEEVELKRYGYELFAGMPTTFAPATDIAIPSDYMMGPNDVLKIQLLGNMTDSHELIIERNGNINFPELEPISLTGLTFDETKALIQQKISEQLIGVRAIVSLGEIRSIRVFVLGEAFKPGSYTVSSLSTMTNAIFVSGGITEIGSLRNIQLKRAGKVITNLDLYGLLQKGDTTGDARILPGDVIYIPPVGQTISISGEVNRPAIYELNGEKSLNETIGLAGGLSAKAFSDIVTVERNSRDGFTSVLDISLSNQTTDQYKPANGDVVVVHSILEDYEDVVTLSGQFHRPRSVKWREGLKVSDIIHSVRDFKDDVDLSVALILRKEMPLREISVLALNLNHVLLNPTAENDFVLMPLDEILVFDKIEDRAEQLEDLVEKISRQTSLGNLVQTVEVSGNVQYPGVYPLSQNMDVSHLINLAGGLMEATYFGRAEVTRRDVSNPDLATVNHINIDLTNLLNSETEFSLKARDKLSIYATPEFQGQLTIEVSGEVRFPGSYDFKRGETLSQVLKRAGGFTPLAHIEASVFTREELKEMEEKLLRELQRKLEREVAASEIGEQQAGGRGVAAPSSNAQDLLASLEETEAVGRLVIKLDKIIAGTDDDILLKNGDMLVVPAFRQEVSVVGEVQRTSSHMFNKEWLLDDYIEGSGGLTDRADQDRIYVVRADGSIFLPNNGGWLSHQNNMVAAGDTIVIPLEADRIKTLTLWTSISQIVYQLALGAAAITRI